MSYSNQFKQELIDHYNNGISVPQISAQSGVAKSTIYSWIKSFEVVGSTTDTTISLRDYTRLKQRTEKLEKIIAVLKTVDCNISSPLKEKLSAMEALHGEYSGYILCEALDVPRGTFYNHIYRNKREESSYSERRTLLSSVIKDVFDESQQRFGAGKINSVLHDRGYVTSPKLVAELMREMGLYSISPFSKREHLKWKKGENKNIVRQKFTADAPNKVWVSDITAFKFREKYYYICAIIDLFSRKVVAYKVSTTNSTQLTTFTFKQAWDLRKPDDGLIFHSDRGAQYVSGTFQKLLCKHKAVQSLSKAGCPHDNAVAESFFAYLKQEELYRRQYRYETELIRGIHAYIRFYNEERPHSTLQYKTPNKYEETALKKQADAVCIPT